MKKHVWTIVIVALIVAAIIVAVKSIDLARTIPSLHGAQ
jgi:hypothetical protein